MPDKEELFRKELFEKQMSKHSTGAYMALCRGVGKSFEAAPLFKAGSMPSSEPDGELTDVRVTVDGLVLIWTDV